MSTGISYLDEVYNPIIGCSHCSPGCDNCWAEGMAYRLSCMESAKRKNQRFYWDYGNVVNGCGEASHRRKWNGKTVFVERMLDKPLHWKKPRNIGVCFMGDLFHESVPSDWIRQVLHIIYQARNHNFLILTKRIDRASELLNSYNMVGIGGFDIVFPNVWLGVSVCNQDEAWKIDVLRDIPAARRWVSCEPMLGPLVLDPIKWNNDVNWIIFGTESGPGRRPLDTDHVREAVKECKAFYTSYDIPVYVKQLDINGKVCTDITKFPKDLQIQEFPPELRSKL